jgi:hypothetical protein
MKIIGATIIPPSTEEILVFSIEYTLLLQIDRYE